MKVIVYNVDHYITRIINDIYDPNIDKEKGVITTSNGRISGLNENGQEFILVEDHVPAKLGQNVETIIDFDRTDKYESLSLEDVKESIEEVGEKIKEEVKELFDKDKD